MTVHKRKMGQFIAKGRSTALGYLVYWTLYYVIFLDGYFTFFRLLPLLLRSRYREIEDLGYTVSPSVFLLVQILKEIERRAVVQSALLINKQISKHILN